ncbi:MAG TPA: DUF1570 domain-containing protein [Planctomycetota bacterium]|nr:DUF1570 domain-containing protein [Planctomycetota bacterium]
MIRRALWPALVFAIVAPARAQDLDKRKEWPVVLRSAHYEIRSTCDAAKTKQLLDHMELVFGTYTKLFAMAQVPNEKLIIVLFKSEEEYESHPESPKGSAAYYNRKQLVGYYHEVRMYNYFAHEGMHQFTDIALKDIDKAPMWFIEGMAECIGSSEVRKGRLFMCAKNGVIAQENLPDIQVMIGAKQHVKLSRFLTMSPEAFMGRQGMYAQAWSFCHFLLAYPDHEDPKAQIPNGKYWTVLSNFIRLMARKGANAGDAIKASFQLKGKPLDIDELEKEWMDYVMKMENDGTKKAKEEAEAEKE